MGNGYLTGVAFALAVLTNLVFFLKGKIDNFETSVYKKMLILNLLESFFTSMIVLIAITINNTLILKILNKVDIIIIITWCSLLFYYVYKITSNHNKNNDKGKNFILIVNSIFYILAVILDVNIINENGIMDSNGSATMIGLIGALIYIFLILVRIFFSTQEQNKKNNKKYIPIYILIILLILAAIARVVIPEINFISIILSFVCLIMYFTIENPDIKMLEQISLAKDHAERANAAKTEFLSNMSHEIRTPLNAIVGFSEAIMDEDNIDAAKNDAKDIIQASQNLLEIVNGILDISKIEANKMDIVNTEYNLKEECQNLIKLIRPRIGEKPIELISNIAIDIPDILYGDKNKIKEIISNLLTNAVKYTDAGEIKFIVSCINKNNESSLIISVEDTGRGIKPEKIDKLFTKFERLSEDRNTTIEGAGLGLAITKSLVEMMGGKIIVQSVYGSGSKFTVYLKQRIINRVDDRVIPESKENEKLELYGKKVLIVDDNDLNIKVTNRLLEKYGIISDQATSGKICLEKINNGNTYDLILMDDMMPKLSGTETLHILKENLKFKTKVVALTANAIEGMKEKYLEEGFDDYLSKPIEKKELERILKKYLNNEIEKNHFEPLPDDFYEISDKAIIYINEQK